MVLGVLQYVNVNLHVAASCLPDTFTPPLPPASSPRAPQPKRDMSYHASNKWLLHLDGQTCSSRLEQLLVLGSLVLKEESGAAAGSGPEGGGCVLGWSQC